MFSIKKEIKLVFHKVISCKLTNIRNKMKVQTNGIIFYRGNLFPNFPVFFLN